MADPDSAHVPTSRPMDAWLDALSEPNGSPGGGAATGVLLGVAAALMGMVAAYAPDSAAASACAVRLERNRTDVLQAVEADGVLLADLDQPVHEISVRTCASVTERPAEASTVWAIGRAQDKGLFDDEDVESVSEQWARLGHMNEQHMPAQWRAVRSLSSFGPKRGEDLTIIDVGNGDTLAYLRATMDQWAVRLQPFLPTDLDVSSITGSDRRLTCAVAWWLQRHTLPDGRRPDGLRYNSRHGTDMECYALWVDLGNYPAGTPIADAVESVYERSETRAIEWHDDELKRAAHRLRLVVH